MGIRSSLGWLALPFLCAGLSCARGPTVLLAVANLPPTTVSLSALAALNDQDAQEMPEFDLSGLSINTETGYRFGLRLPEAATGTLAIGVAAYDRDGKLVAAGDAQGLDAATLGPDRNVSVTLQAVAPEEVGRIRRGAPYLRQLDADPDAPSAETRLQRSARGFGFLKGMAISFVPVPEAMVQKLCAPGVCPAPGSPVSGLSRLSPTELRFPQPPPSSASGKDVLCVVARNPDGGRACQPLTSYRYTFARTTYTPGPNLHPDAIAIADLDGDGQMDLAFSALDIPPTPGSAIAGVVGVMLNQGGGRFAAPSFPLRAGAVRSLVAADLDGDGRPDLAVSSRDSGVVTVLYNPAGGELFPSQSRRDYLVGKLPDSIAVADLDRDRYPDLVVVNDPLNPNNASAQISILRGTGDPQQRFAAPQVYLAGSTLSGVRVADVNHDQWPDVLISGVRLVLSETGIRTVTGGVTVLLNDQRGDFTKYSDYNALLPNIYQVNGLFGGLEAADLDGDGFPEVLASGQSNSMTQAENNVVSVLKNGAGAFPLFGMPSDYPSGKAPFGLATIEVNGDGRPDLLICNVRATQPGTVTLLLSQPQKGGGFFARESLPTYPAGVGSGVLAAGDLNGDRKPDAVAANLGVADEAILQPGSLTVYLNTSP